MRDAIEHTIKAGDREVTVELPAYRGPEPTAEFAEKIEPLLAEKIGSEFLRRADELTVYDKEWVLNRIEHLFYEVLLAADNQRERPLPAGQRPLHQQLRDTSHLDSGYTEPNEIIECLRCRARTFVHAVTPMLDQFELPLCLSCQIELEESQYGSNRQGVFEVVDWEATGFTQTHDEQTGTYFIRREVAGGFIEQIELQSPHYYFLRRASLRGVEISSSNHEALVRDMHRYNGIFYYFSDRQWLPYPIKPQSRQLHDCHRILYEDPQAREDSPSQPLWERIKGWFRLSFSKG